MKYKAGDKVFVWCLGNYEICARREYSQGKQNATLIKVEIITIVPNNPKYLILVPIEITSHWEIRNTKDYEISEKWKNARGWFIYEDDAIFGLAKKIKCEMCT